MRDDGKTMRRINARYEKGKVYMSMETVNGTYGSEEQKTEEMTRYLNGLKRYTEKGIPIYMDGKLSGQREWEKLFEVREDGMFYMGDYVQAEGGGLKEIRFDKVYLSEADISETKIPDGEEEREDRKVLPLADGKTAGSG